MLPEGWSVGFEKVPNGSFIPFRKTEDLSATKKQQPLKTNDSCRRGVDGVGAPVLRGGGQGLHNER